MNNLDILKKSQLLNGLTHEEIKQFLSIITISYKKYTKDSYIISMGDCFHSIGIVMKGNVYIVQDDIWGYRNMMNHLESGQSFGEIFALIKQPSNVHIIAKIDCEIAFIDIDELFDSKILPHHLSSIIIKNLFQDLANKTLLFNERMTHMNKRHTRDKILSYLSSYSLKVNSLSFDIPFNRQQLADYLGVERSAMSVELSKLQKEGMIKTTKNHFQLFIKKGEL